MHPKHVIPERTSTETPLDFPPLPFRLLPPLKPLQNRHLPLQGLQPLPRRLVHLLVIIAQLRVKVLPVRRRGHGGAENGLHHEGMVGFQGAGVGGPEGGRELFGGVLEVRTDAEGGEV